MKTHKETFFQPAHDGIPGHWVVQFYDTEAENPEFPLAEYFEDSFDASVFERDELGLVPPLEGLK